MHASRSPIMSCGPARVKDWGSRPPTHIRIGKQHPDSLITYPDAHNLSTCAQPIRISPGRGYGRERRAWRGNVHHAPPVRKVPAGPRGLAMLRADAQSEARGVDGKRAGGRAGPRGLARLRADAQSEARGVDGERAGPAAQPTEHRGAQPTEHRQPSQQNTGGAAARRVCERPGGESPPPGLYAGLTCR